MPDYYWVGGAGSWSSSDASRWSLTSGGSGGAGVPDQTSNVYFNASSDAGSNFTVTAGGGTCKSLIISGLDRVMTLSLSGWINIHESMTILSSTNTVVSGIAGIVFPGTGTGTITTSGVTLNCQADFTGTGTRQLQDNTAFTGKIYYSAGTIDLNGKTLSSNSNIEVTGSSTKVIAHGSGGILACGNEFLANTATNLTATGTGSIDMTGTLSRAFRGNGNQFATLNLANGPGALNVTGNNIFKSIKSTASPNIVNLGIYFENGSLTTFTENFELDGYATKFITLSAASTTATFTKTFPENVYLQNLSISRLTVDPVGWWAIDSSVNSATASNFGILNSKMIGLFL